jgi:hypothetical protein
VNQINENYSLVITGNVHNPTVISDFFLKNSGIISDEQELDRSKTIITPALCQIFIKKSDTVFVVMPNVLTITSKDSNLPFTIGKKYCSNLGYINSIAVGINFEVLVTDFNFEKWFENYKISTYNNAMMQSFIVTFTANPNTKCNVTITLNSADKATFRFNFHRDTNVPLSNIPFDFIQEANKFKNQANEFIKNSIK